MTERTKCRFDATLAPVSGRAIPVYQGEVLRIIQVEGEQCVDFNCFNLHDYKERMSVGDMRLQGFRLKQGHLLVSAPPRYRPMMAITHMTETCVTDLLGARCEATMGEREFNLVPRTNCQDTLAEAIREYGLTPDDVHDSFNLWMNTCWGESYRILRNVGPPGDFVDLLALMDVLAVPVTCGSGDLGQTGNFSFKPIQIKVFEVSDEAQALVGAYLDLCTGFANQHTRADFCVKQIRQDRGLQLVPGYEPKFKAFPITYTEITVELTHEVLAALQAACGKIGATESDVVRSAFMLWYREHRMKPHWLRPDGPLQSRRR